MLEQVEMLDTMVKNKLIERQQWRDLALCITANMDGERVQSSGSKSKMADAVDRCVDAEAEIDKAVQDLVAKKRQVTQLIERVDSPIWYNLLHMRYIQHRGLQYIADHYNMDYGWATTTHGRALANVQAIIEREQNAEKG